MNKFSIRFLTNFFLAFIFIFIWQLSALGQLSLNTDSNSNNLHPLEVIRYGNIEVIWVNSPLDNEKLFQIASPTVLDRSNSESGNLPVEIRARNIEALLWLTTNRIRGDIFTKIFRPEVAQQAQGTSAQVITSTLNNRPVVQIQYDRTLRPLTIATVTQTDVNFYSQSPEQIVRDWQQSLEDKISEIEYLYSSKVIRHRLKQAIAILSISIIISVISVLIYWWLGQRLVKLQMQYEAGIKVLKLATAEMQYEAQNEMSSDNVESEATASKETKNSSLFAGQAFLQMRLRICNLLRWLLVWLFIIVWYLGIYAITTRVPILMRWSKAVLSHPLQLLAIWFLATLLLEISKIFIHRSINAWKENPYLSFGESQRKCLRLTTIATALKGFVTFVCFSLGIVLTLALFNISAGSILAGGAVIGLAISFGTQSLVKDVVNGCLILLEDRFAVGDVIIVNGMDGLVEEFNLRLTQLRNPEGQLITIPNSAIVEVRNLTRLWSRIDFTIEVAYENDPDKVLEILESIAKQMHHDPQWQDKIIDSPEILGIDSISHTGMLIRVWIKTAPLQQWLVGREYRLRVRRAFTQHGIVIGRPQWISYNATLNGKVLHDLSH